jgi:hypothetical protein
MVYVTRTLFIPKLWVSGIDQFFGQTLLCSVDFAYLILALYPYLIKINSSCPTIRFRSLFHPSELMNISFVVFI